MTPGLATLRARIATSLNFDLMRSLRGEPWLLMEQAASAVSSWSTNGARAVAVIAYRR
jgi:hypothetical protein